MKRYRLYVDESGDHTYRQLDDQAKRYLCLLGLFAESEAYRTAFQPTLEKLKQEHFPHSPDEPIILHRKELINAEGPFFRLRDAETRQRFNEDFLKFLRDQDYELVGVVLDKKQHIERYGTSAYHPYHYCLAALLERYCGFLNFYNATGDVVAESRGGTEDSRLKHEFRLLYTSGTYFHDGQFFQKALSSREIKLKPKSANIAGLQVADLLAYPVKQDILLDYDQVSDPGDAFGREIRRVVGHKYNRQVYQGRARGYGKVFLG